MKRPALSCGFTLIEILVVMFIVSIMFGVTVANLPGFAGTADFELESRRLKTLLDIAREESMAQALELGFMPKSDGYAFYVYNEIEQNWVEYNEAPLHRRTLPEGIKLDLKIEGESLKLVAEKESSIPPLLLLSSGETSIFTLTIYQGREIERSMNCDGYGDINWLEDE